MQFRTAGLNAARVAPNSSHCAVCCHICWPQSVYVLEFTWDNNLLWEGVKVAKRKINKTQLVRDYFDQHPDAGPSEVAEALKKHRISPAYVSNIKFKIRHGINGSGASNGGSSPEAVLAAARFIRICGGLDNARKALRAAGEVAEILN